MFRSDFLLLPKSVDLFCLVKRENEEEELVVATVVELVVVKGVCEVEEVEGIG